MIRVTERALGELKRILLAKADLPQARLRLVTNDQGKLGLGVDIEMPDDRVVEHEGSRVLLVGNSLANSIEGITLDVENTANGPQLVICEAP